VKKRKKKSREITASRQFVLFFPDFWPVFSLRQENKINKISPSRRIQIAVTAITSATVSDAIVDHSTDSGRQFLSSPINYSFSHMAAMDKDGHVTIRPHQSLTIQLRILKRVPPGGLTN
jgi:hypothetical protein